MGKQPQSAAPKLSEEIVLMRQASQRLSRLSISEVMQELGNNHRCLYCGQIKEPYKALGLGGSMWRWPDRHGCEYERLALEEERLHTEEIERERIAQEREAVLRRAGLTGKLVGYTFDQFVARNDWPSAGTVRYQVERYADSVASGHCGRPWLILHGGFGMGKSHLAGAVLHKLIGAGWGDCYFRVWPDYVSRLSASWDARRLDRDLDDEFGAECEADIVNELKRGRVVVIDDIDKRQPYQWTREALFTVLNHRYNAEQPTILTFNYGLADLDPEARGVLALIPFIGQAILERIIESAFAVIGFDGPSYRLKS